MKIVRTKDMIQPPQWMRHFYNGAFWRGDDNKKEVYLTFDDGPVPDPTYWVIGLLKTYGIKATFFCVGDNVRKHPEVFESIVAQGHTVGNHTFHHSRAFSMSRKDYFTDIDLASTSNPAKLFRPPHGQLYPWYMGKLKERFDKVVFWDVMPMDYDSTLSGEKVADNAIRYVRNGSVIVFHDSLKAKDRLVEALPRTIDYLLGEGYTFNTIN
jgi:peptidoglycan/xylan/chitin deacetylase (PgdA/CDA1 family)